MTQTVQTLKMVSVSTIITAIVLSYASFAFAAPMTQVVSGDTSAGENQPGWLFNRDLTTATPFEFNTVAASIGTGSLYILPIGANASDKFIGENFINAPIADVNSISYDFKIASGTVADANQFYMSVYANFGTSSDDKFYDCRYNVVPTTGSTSAFTTVVFDPTQAYDVTQRSSSPFTCPAVPADMNLLSPDSNIRAFALNVGDTSTSDVGLSGHLDNVVVNTDSSETIYDFEPEVVVPPTATTKDDCKLGGYATYGFKNQGQCVKFVETGKDSRVE
ncbi:MAG: hypothetical protein V4606_02560 [Patescibacteria group bacterium]